MRTYRKLPVEVKAVQLTTRNITPLERYIQDCGTFAMKRPNYSGLLVRTLEGDMVASFGDWIIQGVNGEFYPCKDDIFRKTYEYVP